MPSLPRHFSATFLQPRKTYGFSLLRLQKRRQHPERYAPFFASLF
jgi:hypothetical protein